MTFFKRIKNIIRCNINSKEYNDSFENFCTNSDFAEDKINEKITQPENKTFSDVECEYYGNLELPLGASFEQIKQAYKNLLKKYHPDRFYNEPKKLETAQNIVKKLNKAYNYFEEKFKCV